jgi:hypothetical protein
MLLTKKRRKTIITTELLSKLKHLLKQNITLMDISKVLKVFFTPICTKRF